MPTDQTTYDLFLSYARKDNAPIPATFPQGWVTAIRDHIVADHRQFSTAPLRIFFDTEEIKDADDWRFRILGALRHSRILLVCLSPHYFASPYCRWEWEEYVKRQVHQLMGSDSVATVYFVEVPGTDEQATARWREELRRGNYTDLRPFFPEGAAALQREEVRQRLARLGDTLWERLQRARRALAVPGNLRWQNPRFVGRREELRLLHEQLGTGAVGVVTAVHGLGGQGKTELAVAYAHGFADSYPAGLWSLGAEGKKELLPLLGELAWERALGFTPTEQEKNDPALLGRAVLEHLKARAAAVAERDPDRGASALILLDNVSEPSLLSPAQLATLPGGMTAGWLRIVATTRLDLRAQKDRLALLAVDALDEDSALSLLRDHQPPRDAQRRLVPDLSLGQPEFASVEEEHAARAIVRALGGFTLAIEQVALYLGLHPEVAPSAFLATLQSRGLPTADTLPQRDPDVAAQMLTQSKQLGLILDATLARLDAPTRTALAFAALLPPDTVPWPWLRELTTQLHPELAQTDDLGADPWLAIQRRLTGLRLLTPSDAPEIARIHRLVAAHLSSTAPRSTGILPVGPAGVPPAAMDAASETHLSLLTQHLSARADALYRLHSNPPAWELDALLLTLPPFLAVHPMQALANDAVFFAEKVLSYRSIPTAKVLLRDCAAVLTHLAAEQPENLFLQRDRSVSCNILGDVAVAQGDLAAAQRAFGQSLAIRQRLAASDPQNTGWQRDLSISYSRLGNVAVAQGDLAAAQRAFGQSLAIIESLAASDPQNAAWQRDLSVSYNKLGDVAVAQGDLAAARRAFGQGLAIAERLAATDPDNAEWQRDLSISHSKVGELAAAQGDFFSARRSFENVHRIFERVAASDPQNAGWQRDVSISYERLGDLAVAQGDLAAAQRAFGQGLAIRERLTASDPHNAGWQRGLSVFYDRLGNVAVAQGDLPAAQRTFGQSLAIAERLAASDPQNAGWQRDLAVSHYKLALFHRDSGDEAQFVAELRACFAVLHGMKQRGLHFDPAMAQVYEQLARAFGG